MKQSNSPLVVEFSVYLTDYYLDKLPSEENGHMKFSIVDKNSSTAGILKCNLVSEPEETKTLKRKSEELPGTPHAKKNSTSQHQSVPRKDVHTALKDLNLMPQFGNDLACSMCPYIATRKDNLKTHYKLKHLGGADLVMTCQICSIQVKTKSYMKKHYMKVHNLTDSAAQNMASS